MRILGLDVGMKNIGLALSDPFGMTAQNLGAIRRKGDLGADLAALKTIIDSRDVDTIVIGLPKNMNGTLGPAAEMAQNFAAEIGNITATPIVFWDERLTSKMAEQVLLEADLSRKKRKQKIDSLAAVLILQNYLDFLAHEKRAKEKLEEEEKGESYE